MAASAWCADVVVCHCGLKSQLQIVTQVLVAAAASAAPVVVAIGYQIVGALQISTLLRRLPLFPALTALVVLVAEADQLVVGRTFSIVPQKSVLAGWLLLNSW